MIDTTKCIARVANQVNINEKTKHQAINLNDVVNSGLSAGKDLMGLAATVVYASCVRTGEQKSQIDIANAADITEITIRNTFKDLIQYCQEDLQHLGRAIAGFGIGWSGFPISILKIKEKGIATKFK